MTSDENPLQQDSRSGIGQAMANRTRRTTDNPAIADTTQRSSGMAVNKNFTTGRNELPRLVAGAVATGVACWVGAVVMGPGGLTAFWPANGVTLAFLLTAPRRWWPAYLAAGFFANLVLQGLFGLDAWTSFQLTLANGIEVLTAAWVFRDVAPERPDFARATSVLRFLFFCGLVAPCISGLWLICSTPRFMNMYSVATKYRLWVVSDSLGIILFTPLTLALLDPDLTQLFAGRRVAETAGLLGVLAVASYFIFRDQSLPYPFLLLVVLIPVILRLGLSGAAIGILLISFPALHFTLAGRGPLARPVLFDSNLAVQIYFVILLGTIYALSAVRAEEKHLDDELRSSEARYRALAETSQDMILRTTLQGSRTYISPSVERVTGWTEDELPPPAHFSVLVHPADRAHFAGFLDKLRGQPGSHTLVYRARRRDGQYGWLEARVGAVFSETAVPQELVWTIRDISLRIEHEEMLKSEKQKAQELAWTDSLTGLSNRRAFDERLAAEWIFAGQHQAPLSLLLLDVDNFKSYNDTYGHQTGDESLRQIARVIGECTRQSGDLAARYGGEEFVIVLPRASVVRAQEVAERIRERVQELRLEHVHSPAGVVTMSIGVSSASRVDGIEPETLIASADGALYAAKRGGRNRIALAT